jgi:hypothetical protein
MIGWRLFSYKRNQAPKKRFVKVAMKPISMNSPITASTELCLRNYIAYFLNVREAFGHFDDDFYPQKVAYFIIIC